jgi:ketosteroid isomerase-like protein
MLVTSLGEGNPIRKTGEEEAMTGFAVTAVDWLNAYRRQALEGLIHLYDDEATHTCNCDGQKVIAGKAALRSYWLDQFKTHPVSNLLGLQSEDDGESLSFQTSKGVARARLHIDARGRILRVECGLAQ